MPAAAWEEGEERDECRAAYNLGSVPDVTQAGRRSAVVECDRYCGHRVGLADDS